MSLDLGSSAAADGVAADDEGRYTDNKAASTRSNDKLLIGKGITLRPWHNT